jgi:ribose/xylose/arabinose/galactoside ABC-type transport system permease subunit
MKEVAKVSAQAKIIRSKALPLIILLLLLIAVFTVYANIIGARFFNSNTFFRILGDLAIPGFMTIGAGLLIVSGAFDLSQATVGGLAAVVTAVGMAWWGFPWYISSTLAIVIAATCGLCSAILVNELRFQPFIATMAMSTIANAVILLVQTQPNGMVAGIVSFNNRDLVRAVTYRIFDQMPAVALITIVLFIIYGLMLAKSKFGRTLYLVGGNPNAARLAGIKSKGISYALFINCSILSGLAGLVYTFRTQQGTAWALTGYQFTGMTAAILGGISFGGGSGGLGGAFVALLVIRTFSMGMTISRAGPYLTNVLQGALLLAALSFDYYSLRRQQKRIGA